MSTRPLVAHVLYRLDTGGMEHVAVAVINGTRERYRHAVICLDGFGALRAAIADKSVPCIALEKQPGKDPACHLRLWRVLRKLRPDLVQTYNLGTLDLAPAIRLAGVRRHVHAEHGRDAADPRGENRKYQRMRRWMAPFIARFVAVSADLQAWLVERVGLPAKKVVLIPNGIDTQAFAPQPRPAPRPLLGEFAPDGTVSFAHVARLDKVKDQATLLEAFRHLRDSWSAGGSECRLVIVGEGPQRGALEQQIAESGLGDVVRLLGNRADVAALLAECDAFVLSSIAEGMPMTILEAMASGLPVVATDVGGIAAVVADGVSGLLVPAGDVAAMTAALARYAADPASRAEHGRAGRAVVESRYGLEAMLSAYVSLYDSLLDASGRAAAPGGTVLAARSPEEH